MPLDRAPPSEETTAADSASATPPAAAELGGGGERGDGKRLHDVMALLGGRRVAALTGAGISTESGIPDYRGPPQSGARGLVGSGLGGPETRARARVQMQHGEFVRDAAARQRYWARSTVGWPRLAAAEPNRAHFALAAMERAGALVGVITQNVDRLHTRAGSRRVIELHGALEEVACMACGGREGRAGLQERLIALNPDFAALAAAIAPDGDADLPPALIERFRVAECSQCGGALKPDVVFFGGSVPRDVTSAAYALVDAAEALLVVGSSLAVYSGYRFVRRAAESGAPIAIINLGPTRADSLAALCWEVAAGTALPMLAALLAS